MADAQGAFWLFQLPNIAMAAMMYTLIGRFLLSLAYDTDSDRVVWRVFKQISDPVVMAVTAITPLNVPERIVYLFAFLWLFALRIVFYIVMRMYGLAPSIVG